mgnify:CR=1 FL=1
MQEQLDFTRKFSLNQDRGDEIKAILTSVYNSLQEKGYNPINQIVGYLLSEDPTYITNYNNARSLICKLDRDELLQELVRYYHDVVFNAMSRVRDIVDQLEQLVDKSYWPFPNYTDLLFSV